MNKGYFLNFILAALIPFFAAFTGCDVEKSRDEEVLVIALIGDGEADPDWKIVIPPGGAMNIPVNSNITLRHKGYLNTTIHGNSDQLILKYYDPGEKKNVYMEFNSDNSLIDVLGDTVTIDPNMCLPGSMVFGGFQIQGFEHEGQDHTIVFTHYYGEHDFTTENAMCK